MQEVPSGAQNFLEWLVEGLYGFLESIIGPGLVKKTFWFFATIFIFILATNWFGLIPGAGTIGWGHQGEHGFEVTRPLLRGGNADLNMTFAMAMIFFACWIVWALQFSGVKGSFLHIFGPKGDSTGVIKYLMIVVFFAVGFLEVLSIAFRPVSLSFRLYGNMFRGREPAGSHGEHGSASRLGQGRLRRAAAGAVLFHGIAGGLHSGGGIHASDRRVHGVDLHA